MIFTWSFDICFFIALHTRQEKYYPENINFYLCKYLRWVKSIKITFWWKKNLLHRYRSWVKMFLDCFLWVARKAEITFDICWNISWKALNGSNKSPTIDVKCWNQKRKISEDSTKVKSCTLVCVCLRNWKVQQTSQVLVVFCVKVELNFVVFMENVSIQYKSYATVSHVMIKFHGSPSQRTSSLAVVWTNAVNYVWTP